MKNNTYDIFTGDELKVAELIQQRRYQLLIHSCIYYALNQNVISDMQWDIWAKELKTLQEHYPNISEKIMLFEYFEDWDASTGAFLPISEDWVVNTAKHIIKLIGTVKKEPKRKETKKRSLF